MRGFTLIELLVTMAVAAILLGIAVPSFNNLMATSRLAADTNQLLRMLNLARSEAVQRNQPVVMCIADPAEDDCADNSTDWSSGALIFADANGNGLRDDDEAVISVQRPLTARTVISGNGSVADAVRFTAGGRASTIGTLTLTGGSGHESSVVISRTGRSRIAT